MGFSAQMQPRLHSLFMCPSLSLLPRPSLRRFAAEYTERRNRGRRCSQACRLQNRFQLARANHGVHLWNALLNLVAIALHQAACDDELLCRARGFVPRHLQNRVHRLLLGRVDKAASIDDKNLCLFGTRRQPRARAIQQPHHHLGVNKVLRAAQRDKAHNWGSG